MSGTIQSEEHLQKLRAILGKERLTREDGLAGMRHCAAILRHDFLALMGEADFEQRARLFKAVVGKMPGSYKKKTTIRIADESAGPTAHELWYTRGISVALDVNGEVLSTTVDPAGLRKMKKMLKDLDKISGIIKDGPTDMSTRHDDYLADYIEERKLSNRRMPGQTPDSG